MADQAVKFDILVVTQVDEIIYFLRIAYDPASTGDAIGDVFRVNAAHRPGDLPDWILKTNDVLRCMWASPAGSLWVASAIGRVATTAPVGWPATPSALDYRPTPLSPPWSVADLPSERASGLAPNVTALWGTGDDDVYAGTYGGHIYRWNGIAWAQVFEGPGDGRCTIRAFGGAPGDIYAVGKQNALLHFDGQVWRSLAVPEPVDPHESLTGICTLEGKEMLISASGEQGRLLQGSATGGFTELGRYPLHLLGMATLDGRILFPVGGGAAELFGRDVKVIKDNFKAVEIWPGKGRVFFIEPDQERASFVEHDPHPPARPWARCKY